MLTSAFEGVANTVEKVVNFVSGLIDKLGVIGEKAAALKNGVVGTFEKMGDGIGNATNNAVEGAKDTWDGFYNWAVGNSLVPDLVDRILEEFNKMKIGMNQSTGLAVDDAKTKFSDLGSSIEKDFLGTMESALSDGKLNMSDFKGIYAKTMTD